MTTPVRRPLGVHERMSSTVPWPTSRARHADGGFVLDVREPGKYLGGHVPGAVLAPMSRIRSMLGSIPEGQPVHVICQSGSRSGAIADLLVGLGYDAVFRRRRRIGMVGPRPPGRRGPHAR